MRPSIAEETFVPAVIETARIINVNVKDWSVDAVTMLGDKRFFDIQVSSPYLHFNNGEGIYAMPEVGAMCWLCKPSDGTESQAFIMGFQAPPEERETVGTNETLGEFKSGRQTLNPGDIMLRTRDENFIILRRGGVLQIGATPIAQRIYIPIRNIIRDMCENYGMFTLGGEMTWSVERDEKTTSGDAPTQLAFKVKQKANEPEHVALLTLGSHDADDNLVLNLLVKASGSEGAATMIDLKLTKEGNVTWAIEKDFSLTAKERVLIHATKLLELASDTDKASLKGKTQLDLLSDASALLKAATTLLVQADGSMELKSPGITLTGEVLVGGPGAVSPLVKGTELRAWLTQLITVLAATPAIPPTGTLGAVNSGLAPLAQTMQTWLSPKNKVQ